MRYFIQLVDDQIAINTNGIMRQRIIDVTQFCIWSALHFLIPVIEFDHFFEVFIYIRSMNSDKLGAPVGQWLAHCVRNLSAESRGAGSIPAICPGCCMSLSCAVKFLVAILYSIVICNFDEYL